MNHEGDHPNPQLGENMKDIVERIDEIISPAIIKGVFSSAPKGKATSPAIKADLNDLWWKIKEHPMFSKKPKQALKDVIKKQRLNKNWEKLLKGHYKEMMRYA